MLALVYLLLLFLLGDAICRRFYSFVSLPHRIASAFICGLVISAWWTYFSALIFTSSPSPLFWGNLLFFISAGGVVFWLSKRPPKVMPVSDFHQNVAGFEKWDWIFLFLFFLFSCWLMFGTFGMGDGDLLIANHQSSDFGSTVGIMQSFAKGHNFPSEYPHYPGDRIRYHFLFYFQAGNLEYLGFNPALSNNILSVFSMLSMLVIVMTLGAVTFASRAVGRIGAALFFFHGALSFIPFLYAQGSVSRALAEIWKMKVFLPSGYDFRGETWGLWSQVVFANQRHFASSIAIFLVVITFLIIRYRSIPIPKPVVERTNEVVEQSDESVTDLDASSPGSAAVENGLGDRPEMLVARENFDDDDDLLELGSALSDPENTRSNPHVERVDTVEPHAKREIIETAEPARHWYQTIFDDLRPFVFSGILLGLLPMWNGAVFTAAFAVLGLFFLLFPLRRQMIAMGLTTAVVALPQIIYLKTGNLREAGFSLLHWGFTMQDPSILTVAGYLGFIIGVKWLLIVIALCVGTFFHLRFMIAISSLFVLMFCFQFSGELLANHKFLNIWLVIANLFAASGLWYLWNLRVAKSAVIGRFLACILTLLIVTGGVIDLFPIQNSTWDRASYENDRLVNWLLEETDPKAIFLTHRLTNHRILLAGRRIYYGHPYYAWSMGYPTHERDVIYKRMYGSFDQNEVLKLLHENNVSYVIFDDPVRKSDIIMRPNEKLYEAYFPVVFTDPDKKYENLTIYAVPDVLGAAKPNVELPANTPITGLTIDPNGAFAGGTGTSGGQFSKPRGIAVDSASNFYVADTGNKRIQKFGADGKFIFAFGVAGTGEGELQQPNGIAVDNENTIYIVDSLNHKLVNFTPDGKYIKEWTGPDLPFYGPRDIAIGSNKQVYVLDQGRNRVVRFDSSTQAYTQWGSAGNGEGQFSEPTGITVGGNFVFVTDTGNGRIQVFDLDGKFVRQWEVLAWERYPSHYPDAVYDEETKRLYVTSGKTNAVLAFDLEGKPIDGLAFEGGGQLDNPSSLCILSTKKENKLLILNTDGERVTPYKLESKKVK